MHVITRKTLAAFWARHPDAERPLREWLRPMEQSGLKQEDLADIVPQHRISEILSGKRGISKEVAKKLAKRFNAAPLSPSYSHTLQRVEISRSLASLASAARSSHATKRRSSSRSSARACIALWRRLSSAYSWARCSDALSAAPVHSIWPTSPGCSWAMRNKPSTSMPNI